MAPRSERETSTQQTGDNGARDGDRHCQRVLRAGRGIARRHQDAESVEVNAGTFTSVIGYLLTVSRKAKTCGGTRVACSASLQPTRPPLQPSSLQPFSALALQPCITRG